MTVGSIRKAVKLFPRPRTLGLFVIVLTLLAFTAGWLRKELALTLLGTVFLAVLAYCFLGVFLLGVIQRRKARSLSLVIPAETVNTGKEAELLIKTPGGEAPPPNYFFRLPAVLVRCELRLATKDGRVIRHLAEPGFGNLSSFTVKERGAYYSDLQSADCKSGESDRVLFFDAPGFFCLSIPIESFSDYHDAVVAQRTAAQSDSSVHGDTKARLLAVPQPADELIPLSLKSGGTEERNEPHYRKTDELTDHRPYVPGDDPRRINWKLYSHAPLGELFVREGESEPPPHSRLLILIDSEAGIDLYDLDEGRRAIDLLCESALAAALDFSDQGMDILVGYTGMSGSQIMGGREGSGPLSAAELATALAWPVAIPWPQTAPLKETRKTVLRRVELPRAELPPAPNDRAVLVLALPRVSTESSALDRFLKNREAKQETDIAFVYDAQSGRAAELEDAARVCVNLYNRRSGVHAGKAAVFPARKKPEAE